MNKNLIVEVFVPMQGTGCEQGRIATGYPVAEDLILTARHTLYPKDAQRDKNCKIEVRWPYHPEVDSEKWWPTNKKIAWDGGDEFDVVLLRCEIPKEITQRGKLSGRKPRSHTKWESHGFPYIGGTKKDMPQAFPMKGEVYGMADSEPSFHVGTDDGPNVREHWEGASGSPIYTDDGILGVLVSVPDQLDAKRFKAVPTWKLLQNTKFRELVAYPVSRFELQQEIVLALENANTAMDALQEALPNADFPSSGYSERNQRFAELLLDQAQAQAIELLIEALRDAHRKLLRRGQRVAADTVCRVTQALLPAVFQSPAVEEVRLYRFDCNRVLLKMSVATATVAEIVMASAEARKTCFNPPSAANQIEPTYALASPPTSGMDPQGERAARDIEKDMEQKLIPEKHLKALKKAEHRQRMLANRLRRESKEQRTRYITFEFECSSESDAMSVGLSSLKQRYPELVLLELDTDPDLLIEQDDLFQPFELILNPPKDNQ